jgi:hypothetical protein
LLGPDERMINPAVSTKLVLRVSRQNERFPSTLASDAAGAPRRQGSIGRAVDHRGSPQTLYVKPSVALGYFVSCISGHCVCWM